MERPVRISTQAAFSTRTQAVSVAGQATHSQPHSVPVPTGITIPNLKPQPIGGTMDMLFPPVSRLAVAASRIRRPQPNPAAPRTPIPSRVALVPIGTTTPAARPLRTGVPSKSDDRNHSNRPARPPLLNAWRGGSVLFQGSRNEIRELNGRKKGYSPCSRFGGFPEGQKSLGWAARAR